ncbi:MAG: endolytic transglycosylase MltG [Nitriliruptor sp.]|uniref:endolytic transglycosylase MltG n=1 Tax=Nitriliruptor sp. TaxID=2448056 RepID=UPI00349FDC51
MARLSRGSKVFLVVVVVGIAAVVVGTLFLGGQLSPIGSDVEPGQPVELTVAQGESVRSVGDQLEELGVVGSARGFVNAAEDADLVSRLQPGVFALETGMSDEAAVEVLAAGPTGGAGGDIRFTVQEGLTVEETLDRIADQFDDLSVDDLRAVLDERTAAGGNEDGVLQLPDWVPEPAEAGDEIVEPYEGLLFPQTYDVRREATALDVLQRMVTELGRAADPVPEEDQQALEARGLSRYEGLILSSLIERETRVDSERNLVSGVLEGRIEDGMRLQIDATVLYARGEPTDRVLFEDTEIDSPYNTYQVDGLPPTPISGVGNASFLAAYQPEDTTARYYVLAPECDGTHRFADTLDEHNNNVRAFRETGGCGVAD